MINNGTETIALSVEVGQNQSSLADMSHTRHTKTTVHHLGLGEVTVPSDVVAVARHLFLGFCDDLYPKMREDLEALSVDFQETRYGFIYEDCADGPIGEWCRRWGLLEGDKPARWAVKAAFDSMSDFCWLRQRSKEIPFCWKVSPELRTEINDAGRPVIASGGAVPDRPPASFRAELRTLSNAKVDTPPSGHGALSATVTAYLAKGWIKTPKKYDDEHFLWTVKRTIGGLSFEEIATTKDPDNSALPEIVKSRINSVRRLMEWTEKRGRPVAR